MNIDTQQQAAVTVLTPRGPLLAGDAKEVRAAVKDAIASNHGRVVLDISKVPYTDSHGLEMITEIGTELVNTGRVFKLAGANETMREVLALTEVGALCEQFDDVTTAVRSFA
ncbi:MAG: STAS domain-containing protein [Phycisphaerales bacterium]|nr:STAS domain-containing protein [Phycisphaerales bacterium]MCB9836193.1 STAS domain-containing protein [Phycisphaera sp.]